MNRGHPFSVDKTLCAATAALEAEGCGYAELTHTNLRWDPDHPAAQLNSHPVRGHDHLILAARIPAGRLRQRLLRLFAWGIRTLAPDDVPPDPDFAADPMEDFIRSPNFPGYGRLVRNIAGTIATLLDEVHPEQNRLYRSLIDGNVGAVREMGWSSVFDLLDACGCLPDRHQDKVSPRYRAYASKRPGTDFDAPYRQYYTYGVPGAKEACWPRAHLVDAALRGSKLWDPHFPADSLSAGQIQACLQMLDAGWVPDSLDKQGNPAIGIVRNHRKVRAPHG